MTRIFGQYVLADMVVLWAFETLVCFLLFLAALDHVALVPAAAHAGAADSACLLSLLAGLLCIAVGLYKPSFILATRTLLPAACVAAVGTVMILWAASSAGLIDAGALLGARPAWLGELLAMWLGLLVGTRLLYAACVRSGLLVREVLVLGDGPSARSTVKAMSDMRPALFRATVASSPSPAASGRLSFLRIVMATEGDVIGEVPAVWAGRLARLTDAATFWERHLGRVDVDALGDVAAAVLVPPASKRFVGGMRRAIDIAIAAVLLLAAGPLMIVTATAIAIGSPGPVIYRQERVGLGGRRFTILKFRSMRMDAERDGVARFAQPRDARTTMVGRFIRKVRIDELPQLINVIRGEMSIVGPRPERPEFVERYRAVIPGYDMRHAVKPGLTGWAQVNSAYTASEAETREKVSYDLYYVRRRSLALDLSIMVSTVRVILFQIGSR